jgi:hypothetical protein
MLQTGSKKGVNIVQMRFYDYISRLATSYSKKQGYLNNHYYEILSPDLLHHQSLISALNFRFGN